MTCRRCRQFTHPEEGAIVVRGVGIVCAECQEESDLDEEVDNVVDDADRGHVAGNGEWIQDL